MHHSHDAYLNVVVGNVYNIRFNHNRNYWKNDVDKFKQFDQNHIFEYEIKDAWNIGGGRPDKNCFEQNDEGKAQYKRARENWYKNGETITKVRRVVSKNWYTVTKKVVENKGAFYNETLYGVEARQKQVKLSEDGKLMKDNPIAIPLKGLELNPRHNYKKYGYFKSKNPAYFTIVEHTLSKGSGKKKQDYRQRQFVAVPILDLERLRKTVKNDVGIAEEVIKGYNFTEPKIIVPKIYKYTLFNIGEMECRLAGWNGQFKDGAWTGCIFFHNAKEFYPSDFAVRYIKNIGKYNEDCKKKITNPETAREDSTLTEILLRDNNLKSNPKKLTKQDNERLFYEISEKLNALYGSGSKISEYCGKSIGLPDIINKLNGVKEVFRKVPIGKQIDFLSALVLGIGCNANAFDFSALGKFTDDKGKEKDYPSSVGKIQPSIKIEYPLVLVEESVTGNKTKRTTIYPFKV